MVHFLYDVNLSWYSLMEYIDCFMQYQVTVNKSMLILFFLTFHSILSNEEFHKQY